MIRAAARKFEQFQLVWTPTGTPWFRCKTCGDEMVAQKIGDNELAELLDMLLDHAWLHDPASVGAPTDEIDARVNPSD